MDIREDLVSKLGGEVVQPQQVNNVVDVSEVNPPAESIENSSLNTDKGDVTTNVTDPQTNQPIIESKVGESDVLSFLSEKLGRDVTSFDDFEKGEPVQAESFDFASEQLKVINDYVKDTGRTVQDYLDTQTVDLQNLSDDVLMKEYLKLENPDLTEAELSDYMDDSYKLDKEEHSEREGNVGKVKLKKDAKVARDYFTKIKEDYAMPTQSETSNGMSETEKADWVSSMETSVDNMEGLSFNINEQGEEFVYNLDAEALSEIKGHNSNLEGFFDKYTNEGGDWNFDKLNTDMYILNNIDKIVRGVANQYKSKGTENVINEIKNPSFNQDKKQAPSSGLSTLDMLRNEIFG